MEAPLARGERIRLPKSNPLEHSVEQHLRSGVERLGGIAVKLEWLTGWPDRLILWANGVVHFVETKRPKGSRFQPRQPRIRRLLRGMGYMVFTLYTRQQVDTYLQRFRPEPSSRGNSMQLKEDFLTQTRRALFFHAGSDSYFEVMGDKEKIQQCRAHPDLVEVTSISVHEKAFLEDLW